MWAGARYPAPRANTLWSNRGHSDLGGSNFRFFYPHFSFYFWVAIVVKYQKFVVATGFLSFKYQFFDNLFSNLLDFRRQIRKTQIPRWTPISWNKIKSYSKSPSNFAQDKLWQNSGEQYFFPSFSALYWIFSKQSWIYMPDSDQKNIKVWLSTKLLIQIN